MTMPDTVTRTINSIKSLVIIISHIVVAYLLFSLCMTLLFMLCSLLLFRRCNSGCLYCCCYYCCCCSCCCCGCCCCCCCCCCYGIATVTVASIAVIKRTVLLCKCNTKLNTPVVLTEDLYNVADVHRVL